MPAFLNAGMLNMRLLHFFLYLRVKGENGDGRDKTHTHIYIYHQPILCPSSYLCLHDCSFHGFSNLVAIYYWWIYYLCFEIC
jgi:hypothetical protein